MFKGIWKILREILAALGLYRYPPKPVRMKHDPTPVYQQPPPVSSQSIPQYYPYRLRDGFLSPAEFNFFKMLESVVVDKAFIFTKVSLNDIFWVQSNDPSQFRTYTNKIDRKHVDFLLCNPKTIQPILGIELDDKSHQRQDRQERDAFVDEVFYAAELPLLHIPVRRAYQVDELVALLAPYLEETHASTPQPIAHAAQTENQCCPKCGGEMLLRTAKKGANAGNQFWGCSNYPNCRSMLPYQGQP
jgi:hypothetical protein